MIALLRLATRHIGRRLFQSALFVLGVALGVGVIVAIDIANGSASRAFALSSESVTGKATHQIVGGPNGFSSELYTRLRLELGIKDQRAGAERVCEDQRKRSSAASDGR